MIQGLQSAKTKDETSRVALAKRRRSRQNKTDGSTTAETIKNAIHSAIGNRVQGLKVAIEGDRVIVTAIAPSFYIRQIAEHKCRSLIVENMRKKFVSRVVVNN